MKAKLVIILDYVWYKKIIVEFFFSKSNNLKDSELDKDHDIGSHCDLKEWIDSAN